MDNEIVQFGKYQGLTFKQALDKDVPYAEWMERMQPNLKTEKYIEYVKLELPAKKREILKKKIEEMSAKLKA